METCETEFPVLPCLVCALDSCDNQKQHISFHVSPFPIKLDLINGKTCWVSEHRSDNLNLSDCSWDCASLMQVQRSIAKCQLLSKHFSRTLWNKSTVFLHKISIQVVLNHETRNGQAIYVQRYALHRTTYLLFMYLL